MGKKVKKAERTFSSDELLALFIEKGFSFLSKAVWPAALFGILYYFFRDAVPHLAGQDTGIDLSAALVFDLLGDWKEIIQWLFTIGLGGWAVLERILRLRKVEKLQGRIILLEQRLDPNRSSSGLTRTGLTNPKDR